MKNPLNKTVEDVMSSTIGQLAKIEEREKKEAEKLEKQIEELNQKKELSESQVKQAKMGIRNFTKLFTQELPEAKADEEE